MHDTHRPGTNFLPDGPPFGQHGTFALELVAVFNRITRLAFHCFRTRLQDVNLAVHAVFTPFDIHGSAIVVFNDQGVAR